MLEIRRLHGVQLKVLDVEVCRLLEFFLLLANISVPKVSTSTCISPIFGKVSISLIILLATPSINPVRV